MIFKIIGVKSILCIFILLIALPLNGQIRGKNGADYLFTVALSKSLYTTPDDRGIAFGGPYVWIPDVEVGVQKNSTRLALDYRNYNSNYQSIRYIGDIEIREFSVFDLTYNRQRVLNSKNIDVSLGVGLSLRFLNELEITDVIMTSGGWYEIFSDWIRTTSLGASLNTDCRYDLTRRLYIAASLSYNAYLNSYNMGRMGLSVGYYLGR